MQDSRPVKIGSLLIIIAVFLIGGIGLSFLIKGRAPDMEKSLAAVISSEVVEITNKKRNESDLRSLKYSPLLSQAAQMKAFDMSKREYFSHQDPMGAMPWMWLDKVGYDYSYAGENLGLNFLESGELIEAWMNSEMHRKNVLNENYTEIGIGIARGNYEDKLAVYIVEFLAKPANALYSQMKSRKNLTSNIMDSSDPNNDYSLFGLDGFGIDSLKSLTGEIGPASIPQSGQNSAVKD